MIIAGNLTKRFGAMCALDVAAFSTEDGQITGMLGPNGAGKTTLSYPSSPTCCVRCQ